MFKIKFEDSKSDARTGVLKTAHGLIKTPFFMPVATKAAPRFVSQEEVKKMGADAIICNAFILSLMPGVDVIKQAGGIHKFMKFNKSIFTDCGGFQILKESFFLGTKDEGIKFKSPFDGKRMLLTPEKIIEIQKEIGSDAAMTLDYCPAYGLSYEQTLDSMKKTHLWAERSKKAHASHKQLLFGIAQGGFFKDLRIESTKFIDSLDFDGISLGGLCIGEPKKLTYEMIDCSIRYAAKEKLKYIMGVGSPDDIVKCVSYGIDAFDSIFPVETAKHSTMFTWDGKISIDSRKYKHDFSPLDEKCNCFVCRTFSKAYLYHLAKAQEPLGFRLRVYHNLYFVQELMRKIRESIKKGSFAEFSREIQQKFSRNNSEN